MLARKRLYVFVVCLCSFFKMETIKQRVNAVRDLLANAQPSCQQLLARTQAAALISLLRRYRHTLDLDQLSELQTLVSAPPRHWHGFDAEILAALQPEADGGGGQRRKQQQICIERFLTVEDWGVIGSDVPNDTKRRVIANRAGPLGVRCIREGVAKLMNSIALFKQRDVVSSDAYAEGLAAMKKMMKQVAAALDAEKKQQYIEVYPDSPGQLLVLAPSLYTAAYQDTAGPVACPHTDALLQFNSSFKCRGGARATGLAVATPQVPHVGGLDQLASAMAIGFQQMQASQMQALQQISNTFGDIPLQFARRGGDAGARHIDSGAHGGAAHIDSSKPMAIMDGEAGATAAAAVSVQARRPQPKSSVMDIIEAFENRKKPRKADPKLDDTAN